MRERLRKIAELAAGTRIVFFGEQANIVAQCEQSLEQCLRGRVPPRQRQIVGEPERAGKEPSFAFGQAVHFGRIAVARNQAVAYEFAKVFHLYDAKLGIGDRCRIEFFVGPHTINGRGTFDFLHKHLNWPKP